MGELPHEGAPLEPPWWKAYIPGRVLVATTTRASVRPALIAAATVTALLIPSGLAYGQLAGLDPVAGLYTGMLGMALYALFASSRVQIMGPESQMAILVAAALAPLAQANTDKYVALAGALALVCAVICIGAALARLGFLADYFSQPVLVGYITGVALIIIAGQLGKLLGFSVSGDTLVDLVISFFEGLGGWSLTATAVGVATVVVVLVLRRFLPRWPGSLIAVVLFTAISALVNLQDRGVVVVGRVPSGLPAPHLPSVTWTDITHLIGPAAGIVLIVFADAVLTARSYAARAGNYRIDANAELLGIGTANIGVGLFGGFPVGSSDSRTAVNFASGGGSQLVSLFAAALTALFLLFLTPLISPLPSPTLAGVVIVAAISLVRPRDFISLWRFRRFEVILALITLAGVSIIGILPGILIAVGVNLLDVIYRLSRPAAEVLGHERGSTRFHAVSPVVAAAQEPGLLVVRYGGPLLFANSEYVTHHLRSQVRRRGKELQWVVIDCEAITALDTNGVAALSQVYSTCRKHHLILALARVTQPLEDALRRTPLWDAIGEDHIFDRVADAAAAYRSRRDTGPSGDQQAPQ